MVLTFLFLFSCATELYANGGGHARPKWGYAGDDAPRTWSHNYHLCGGKRQSPINLKDTAVAKHFQSFKLKHFDHVVKGTQFTITNNGHAVQVNINPDHYKDYPTSGGGLPGTYIPLQFHFHWGSDSKKGSEHRINNVAFPMELHIVHRNSKYSTVKKALKYRDGLAVLGSFFKVSSTPSPVIDKLIKHFNKIMHPGSSVKIPPFALRSLLPINTSRFYRYMGSLTTPPCSQAVVWTLFEKRLPISEKQLEKFRQLLNGHGGKLSNNFRPIQKINKRVIKKSF